MKIAIDIDEVILEFVEPYMKFAESKGIMKVNYNDVYCYDFYRVLVISKDRFFEILNEFNSNGRFSEAEFINGAKKGVCFLRDNFDICFVTARPDNIREKTIDFIFKEFVVDENRVFFSGDSLLCGKSKCEICNELGINLIIEDNGDDSLRYANNEMNVLLLDKPWNRHIEHEKIVRCDDWNDILSKVEEVRNGKIF